MNTAKQREFSFTARKNESQTKLGLSTPGTFLRRLKGPCKAPKSVELPRKGLPHESRGEGRDSLRLQPRPLVCSQMTLVYSSQAFSPVACRVLCILSLQTCPSSEPRDVKDASIV